MIPHFFSNVRATHWVVRFILAVDPRHGAHRFGILVCAPLPRRTDPVLANAMPKNCVVASVLPAAVARQPNAVLKRGPASPQRKAIQSTEAGELNRYSADHTPPRELGSNKSIYRSQNNVASSSPKSTKLNPPRRRMT